MASGHIIYNPAHPVIPNKVVGLLTSRPPGEVQAKVDAGFGALAIADVSTLPDDLLSNRKVVGGQLVAFDAADLAAIAAANAAAMAQARTEQTQWLKDQLTATNEVLPHVFRAMAIEMLTEINNRIGGNPRTQSAFLNAVADRANALIDARP